MNAERLAEMVNDIASYFHAEPDRQTAVDGICNHLQKFWEPRMRLKIVAHLRQSGGSDLSDLGRAAVDKLASTDPAQAQQPA